MTIVKGRALTNKEELHEAVARIDLAQIYADYMQTNNKGLLNHIKKLLDSTRIQKEKNSIAQLQFLDSVQKNLISEATEMQAYIMLGGLDYARKKWGAFPQIGPLRDLALKRDDLIQIISENDPEIKLENLLQDPEQIPHKGLKLFKQFATKHKEIISWLNKN